MATKNNQKTTAFSGFIQKTKLFFERVWKFVKPNYPLFLAPAIVLVLYLFMCGRMGVYPFGNKTVASYDLSAQIVPFIEHLFDVMDGRASLFFSYSVAGGADVFGTFAYFFISPFSFLFLLFGEGMVAHTSIIVMSLKLIAIAFSGAWFAQKLFKNIPPYLCTAIGVLYAFCGYTFVSNTYINWMDLLIYMPFCVQAFIHFDKTGKYMPFALLVAACIYTCFSLVSFSLMTVFPALVCYGLICKQKGERIPFIGRLCLAFVVAVLIASPLLVSSLLAFVKSARGGKLFQNLYWGLSSDGTFNSTSFKNWWGMAFAAKWTYIFSDAIFVILTVAYFFKSGLKTPISKFMFVCFGFTILPTIVDESMNLLNAGSYMSYALRFGFLNAIFWMAGTCLFLNECCFKIDRAYDGTLIEYKKRTPKKEQDLFISGEQVTVLSEEETVLDGQVTVLGTEVLEEKEVENDKPKSGLDELKAFFKAHKPRAPHYICLGVTAIVFGLLTWFLGTAAHVNIWEKLGLSSDWKFSAGAFAHSVGGLSVMTVVFFVVGVVMLTCGFFVMNKKVSMQFVSVCLCAIALVQVCFYSEQIVYGNLSTQHTYVQSYREVIEQVDDNSYFRVKDLTESVNKNAPFQTNAPAVSVFSSVIDKSNFKTAILFGYQGNGKNSYGSSMGNAFSDAFLGYKYVVVQKDKRIQADRLTYLTRMTKQIDGGEAYIESDLHCIYQNNIVFPSAYTVRGGEFRLSKENLAVNRSSNQLEFFRYVSGNDSYTSIAQGNVAAVSAALWQRAATIEVGANTIKATVTAEAGQNLLLNFVAIKGYTAKVNGKEVELVGNDLDLLLVPLEEGENVVELKYTSPYPKYFAVVAVVAAILLAAVILIEKKTKFMKIFGRTIGWLGVVLALGITGFFFVFPTGVWLWKIIRLCFPFFF